MTNDQSGWIVRSTAGRDKDKLYLVWQSQADIFCLVDGDKRRINKPKRKRRKHLSMLVMLEEREFADIRAALREGSADSRVRSRLKRYQKNEDR